MKQKYLELDDVMEFGKHKGCDVEDLIGDDPDYLAWLHERDVVEFSDELVTILEKNKVI